MKEKTTKVLPLLALRGILVFPNMIMHLDVGREKSVAALEKAMVEDNEIFLVSQRQANLDDPRPEDLFTMGTVAGIKQILKLPGGYRQSAGRRYFPGKGIEFPGVGALIPG
jgi:ATP-dependent Lon protease